MNTPSTAILCIARNEHAYLTEWIEYHLQLGFDRIHLVSTDSCYKSLVGYFENSTFKSKINFNHFSEFKPGWQIKCYQTFFSQIQEDWVIVIDIDEYIYLNKFDSIQSFISSFNDEVGQIQFPWLNTTTLRYYHKNTIDILNELQCNASDHVKSLVRRSQTSGLGIHSHNIRASNNVLSSGEEVPRKNKHKLFIQDTSYYIDQPFILHFSSRGHFDTLNKIIDHQFFNAKSGNLERERLSRFLTEEPSWKNLPNRYFILKLHQALPEVSFNTPVSNLNASTDNSYLFDSFLKIINKVVKFGCSELSDMENHFEKEFQLQEKLTFLDLPNKIDLESYINSNSQIQHVHKLRKQLTD